MTKKKPKEVCPVCEWDIKRCLGHTPGEAMKLMHRQRELLRIQRDRLKEGIEATILVLTDPRIIESYRCGEAMECLIHFRDDPKAKMPTTETNRSR